MCVCVWWGRGQVHSGCSGVFCLDFTLKNLQTSLKLNVETSTKQLSHLFPLHVLKRSCSRRWCSDVFSLEQGLHALLLYVCAGWFWNTEWDLGGWKKWIDVQTSSSSSMPVSQTETLSPNKYSTLLIYCRSNYLPFFFFHLEKQVFSWIFATWSDVLCFLD